ncbi:MAG: hypothetical protein FWF54_07755 [Candidatus Azobacteroides sp.]|nr:hypothetical protein [Candidatus Azobacteroides sp.]
MSAWILLISISASGIFVFILDRLQRKKELHTKIVNRACSQGEYCCGAHVICESGKKKPEKITIDYYEDEELDRFRNKPSDEYTEEEIEEFREIHQTLRSEEINGWLGSLKAREINFPESLKEMLP